MPYMGSLEYKVAVNGDLALNFVRAGDAHNIQETWLREDVMGRQKWNSFNVYVNGETWVLAADRLSLGDLVKFAMGTDYERRVDFALPRSEPYWLGWDYNNKSTFGEALTAQTVMRAYHNRVRSALKG